MKNNTKKLITCIAVPLAVGGLAALLTGGGMKRFETLEKPPLSPPGWLFPVVWTILYLLMGLASYLVLVSGKEKGDVRRALFLYAAQLALNFFWPIFFFSLSAYVFSFLWLCALWILVLMTTSAFLRLLKPAGQLLFAYVLWVTFAGYLNFGVALLN